MCDFSDSAYKLSAIRISFTAGIALHDITDMMNGEIYDHNQNT
jgi:hypothetical protein